MRKFLLIVFWLSYVGGALGAIDPIYDNAKPHASFWVKVCGTAVGSATWPLWFFASIVHEQLTVTKHSK